MLETSIGPIATEWYRPRTEDRPFATNLQLGRVMTGFYGRDAISLCRKLIAGMTFSGEQTERINTHFLNSSSKIYNLPDQTDPLAFYKEQRNGAIAVIQYFGKLVPELAEDFELRDEITHLSDRPSDLLELLSSSPKKIDPTLAYEAQRHAVIVYQLGMINARALNGTLRNVLADVQDLLNEQLFEGPQGSGTSIFLESFHDDETNQVVGFPDRNDHRPLTAHLKRMRTVVRNIPEVGLIHKKPREKDLAVTIVKSWVKALRNGGQIHIDDAVQDSIGMRFVLMDDSVPPEQLADLVASVIKAGIESRMEVNHPKKIPNITKIEKDDVVGIDHGQSPEINFNARRKIWFDGIPTPIELIFYNRETYLNSRLEVGTRDSETGLYMGRAHGLFDLRRVREGVDVPFPEEIYPVDDYTKNVAFVNRSKQVAYGLRNMYRAVI